MVEDFPMDQDWGGCGGKILEWFKHISFIVHFIPILITSAPPQIIRHQISEAGDPWSRTSAHGLCVCVCVCVCVVLVDSESKMLDVYLSALLTFLNVLAYLPLLSSFLLSVGFYTRHCRAHPAWSPFSQIRESMWWAGDGRLFAHSEDKVVA